MSGKTHAGTLTIGQHFQALAAQLGEEHILLRGVLTGFVHNVGLLTD